jgi:serine/threonine-protein kinase
MIYDLDKLKGQVLGQYELTGLLGAGGMGAVYRGYQETLQREVAVKVIYAMHEPDSQHEERFLREARTAAALEHAHIVPVYDFGTDQGISYVVMRLLGGSSLARLIDDSMPRMPLGEVAKITSDLASALQYAHDRDVIHRDIKASNVMFDDHGTVFLVDFGVAKMMSGTGASLTGSGFKVGTPAFMAPEQWRNEDLTPAVDQYALSILVYHMLTGQLPFRGELPYQLMHSHLNEPPDPLFRWRDDLPDSLLMPVLERAMR